MSTRTWAYNSIRRQRIDRQSDSGNDSLEEPQSTLTRKSRTGKKLADQCEDFKPYIVSNDQVVSWALDSPKPEELKEKIFRRPSVRPLLGTYRSMTQSGEQKLDCLESQNSTIHVSSRKYLNRDFDKDKVEDTGDKMPNISKPTRMKDEKLVAGLKGIKSKAAVKQQQRQLNRRNQTATKQSQSRTSLPNVGVKNSHRVSNQDGIGKVEIKNGKQVSCDSSSRSELNAVANDENDASEDTSTAVSQKSSSSDLGSKLDTGGSAVHRFNWTNKNKDKVIHSPSVSSTHRRTLRESIVRRQLDNYPSCLTSSNHIEGLTTSKTTTAKSYERTIPDRLNDVSNSSCFNESFIGTTTVGRSQRVNDSTNLLKPTLSRDLIARQTFLTRQQDCVGSSNTIHNTMTSESPSYNNGNNMGLQRTTTAPWLQSCNGLRQSIGHPVTMVNSSCQSGRLDEESPNREKFIGETDNIHTRRRQSSTMAANEAFQGANQHENESNHTLRGHNLSPCRQCPVHDKDQCYHGRQQASPSECSVISNDRLGEESDTTSSSSIKQVGCINMKRSKSYHHRNRRGHTEQGEGKSLGKKLHNYRRRRRSKPETTEQPCCHHHHHHGSCNDKAPSRRRNTRKESIDGVARKDDIKVDDSVVNEDARDGQRPHCHYHCKADLIRPCAGQLPDQQRPTEDQRHKSHRPVNGSFRQGNNHQYHSINRHHRDRQCLSPTRNGVRKRSNSEAIKS